MILRNKFLVLNERLSFTPNMFGKTTLFVANFATSICTPKNFGQEVAACPRFVHRDATSNFCKQRTASPDTLQQTCMGTLCPDHFGLQGLQLDDISDDAIDVITACCIQGDTLLVFLPLASSLSRFQIWFHFVGSLSGWREVQVVVSSEWFCGKLIVMSETLGSIGQGLSFWPWKLFRDNAFLTFHVLSVWGGEFLPRHNILLLVPRTSGLLLWRLGFSSP